MNEIWVTQLRKGIVEICILAILMERESYGYRILNDLEKKAGLNFKESTLYLLLGRLHKDRLVSVKIVKSEKGPKRRYYAITPLGIDKYNDMVQHWSRMSISVNQLIKDSVKT